MYFTVEFSLLFCLKGYDFLQTETSGLTIIRGDLDWISDHNVVNHFGTPEKPSERGVLTSQLSFHPHTIHPVEIVETNEMQRTLWTCNKQKTSTREEHHFSAKTQKSKQIIMLYILYIYIHTLIYIYIYIYIHAHFYIFLFYI